MELDEYRRMAAAEDAHWWYRNTRALLEQELGPLLATKGRLLDVGAGTGATGAWMATRGSLVAADIEPMALALYRERHLDTVGLVASDANRLPFADSAFDAVLCVTVLYHAGVPEPMATVHELARVLRPGGRLCLWEPGVRRLHRAHDRVTHGVRRFSLADLRALLTGSGLTVERSTGAYSFLVPPAAIKTVLERGRTSSDLGRHESGLGGALGAVASAERALLRKVSLPFGLSVLAIGRKPPHLGRESVA
jgi:SAM-dependent methyltransferase